MRTPIRLRSYFAVTCLAFLGLTTAPALAQMTRSPDLVIRHQTAHKAPVVAWNAWGLPDTPTPSPKPQKPIPAPELKKAPEPLQPIEQVIAEAWPYDDAWAICTTRRESVNYTDFIGRAGERGPFQIHPSHERSGLLSRLGLRWDEMPTDPHNWTPHQIRVNTAAAVYLFDHGGKGHWTASC